MNASNVNALLTSLTPLLQQHVGNENFNPRTNVPQSSLPQQKPNTFSRTNSATQQNGLLSNSQRPPESNSNFRQQSPSTRILQPQRQSQPVPSSRNVAKTSSAQQNISNNTNNNAFRFSSPGISFLFLLILFFLFKESVYSILCLSSFLTFNSTYEHQSLINVSTHTEL